MNGPDPASLTFDPQGLIVAVAQEIATGTVLMVAYMDREAVARTLDTGEAHFFRPQPAGPLAQRRDVGERPARRGDPGRL